MLRINEPVLDLPVGKTALSEVVERTCREFGVHYAANKSFFGAMASHFRWLTLMGRPDRPIQSVESGMSNI